MQHYDYDDSRRSQMARFGYLTKQEPVQDLSNEAVWSLVLPDFLTPRKPLLPALSELPSATREMVIDYLALRKKADLAMDQCDLVHRKIAKTGPSSELVEEYAVVRDGFEDAVDQLAVARDRVTSALSTL